MQQEKGGIVGEYFGGEGVEVDKRSREIAIVGVVLDLVLDRLDDARLAVRAVLRIVATDASGAGTGYREALVVPVVPNAPGCIRPCNVQFIPVFQSVKNVRQLAGSVDVRAYRVGKRLGVNVPVDVSRERDHAVVHHVRAVPVGSEGRERLRLLLTLDIVGGEKRGSSANGDGGSEFHGGGKGQ